MTLVGAPGVGKTRLATEVAARVQRAFADGAWMVELASLEDPGKVGQTVLAALGVAEPASRTRRDEDIYPLRDRTALVLLDNCEHVLDEVAMLTSWLLRSCPKLHFLATSREPLGIEGEHIHIVAPLSAPDPASPPPLEAMRGYESVQLLVERARAVRPDFAVTAENRDAIGQLCEQLDGLPLAIELAATRLRSLAVADVVTRLDRRFALLVGGHRDRRPRQQTLRALMDWSYERCTAEERTLWARLAVFAGSFGLEDVEEVCSGEDVPQDVIAHVLDSLVAKSLVTVDRAEELVRYRLLVTVRDYGAELLKAAGAEDELRRRHRDHYLRVARSVDNSFQQGQTRALTRLRREHPNLRAALAWSLSRPEEVRAGAALAGALQYHWFTDVFLREGMGWCERALDAAPDPTPERATALWVGALLALTHGQLARTAQWLEESRSIAERTGEGVNAARDAHGLGLVRLFAGDAPGSLAPFEAAIAGHRAAGEVAWELSSRYSAVVAFAYAEEFERGRAIGLEALDVCDRHGDRWARGFVHFAIGVLEWRDGKLEAARKHALQALEGERELIRGLCVAYSIELLSWIAAAQDASESAARLQGMARALWSAMGIGVGYGPGAREDSAEASRRVARALGDPKYQKLLDQQVNTTLEEAVSYALQDGTKPPVSQAPSPAAALLPLSARESEVADLIAGGKSNKIIAQTLIVSPRTVDGHVERILAKLDLQSRTQIAAWVLERRHLAQL